MMEGDMEETARTIYEDSRFGDPDNRPAWKDLDPQITADAQMREYAYARARDRLAPAPVPALYEEDAVRARFS